MHTPNQSPIYLIALGAFALGMASYVTAGLIPMIEASFAVSVAVAAQLVTAFTLAYGLGSPIFVALTPAHRQRAGLLLALGLFVIANATSALAEDFTTLMVWRAIAGIGAGVYLAMGIGASAAVSTPERRGKAIAIIMGGMASGVVLGVPLSLLIAEQMGWQAALWLVTLLGLVAFFGLLLKLPALPAATATTLGQKLAILGNGHVLVILLVSLLAAIASLGMYTFIAPLLILARQAQGDGNLAIALNESALYLGSAIGAAAGGFVLLLQMPTWTLAASAGGVAALGALLQIINLRRQPSWTGDVQAEPYN